MGINSKYVFSIDPDIVFEFESFDNLERPQEERMRAYIRNLSGAETNKIFVKNVQRLKKGADGEIEFESVEAVGVTEEMNNLRVSKLENIFFDFNGEMKEVKTYQELSELNTAWASRLWIELRTYLANLEIPEKN